MLTSPTLVASAFCSTNVVPDITAPLADLVWLSIVPIVVTPAAALLVKDTQVVPFHIKLALVPVATVAEPIVKLAEPTLFMYMIRPAVVTVGLGIVTA